MDLDYDDLNCGPRCGPNCGPKNEKRKMNLTWTFMSIVALLLIYLPTMQRRGGAHLCGHSLEAKRGSVLQYTTAPSVAAVCRGVTKGPKGQSAP